MEKWPGWAAPMLGACGGGIAGIALTGDPRFPFPLANAMVTGVALGALAGLIVWLRDTPHLSTETPPAVETQPISSTTPPRWIGSLFIVAGIGCLVLNHALVVLSGQKLLAFVMGGSFFVAIGLLGLLSPRALIAGAAVERLRWYDHLIGGIFAVGGLALGFYLWLAVY